jgi:CHASE3 domain sensor protein
MAESLAQLKKMTDEELVEQHDRHAQSTMVGTGHYLAELRSRENERLSASVEKITKYIFWLTCVMAVATLVQLVLALLTFASTQ